MSTAGAKSYIKRLKTDKAFAKKINGCKGAGERLSLAKAEGFEFTAAELAAEKAQLSAADLDKVAGGGKPPCKSGTDVSI